MEYALPSGEIQKAEWSFGHYPPLARECSGGLADITSDIVYVDRPISSLTSLDYGSYWVSPSDVGREIRIYAPPGAYDSIFVHWPQSDLKNKARVPSPGWGLAVGPGYIAGGATYCTIANAPDNSWDVPLAGEVWLHEWLHGVCDFYESKGFPMPERNADGGGLHGYVQSPVIGWGAYYKDLMTGQVKEKGRLTGITPRAWLSGTIRSALKEKCSL